MSQGTNETDLVEICSCLLGGGAFQVANFVNHQSPLLKCCKGYLENNKWKRMQHVHPKYLLYASS